jgi:hypothetical protein
MCCGARVQGLGNDICTCGSPRPAMPTEAFPQGRGMWDMAVAGSAVLLSAGPVARTSLAVFRILASALSRSPPSGY